jgi:hypothetical protein
VGGDIAIIMQGHHDVSLYLLPSATLDSLFDAQAEILVDADVSLWLSFRRNGRSIRTLLLASGEALVEAGPHLVSSPRNPAVLCILRRHWEDVFAIGDAAGMDVVI